MVGTLADGVGARAADRGREVAAVGRGRGRGGRCEHVARRGPERAAHRACVAEPSRQPPRVDAADGGHPVLDEEPLERPDGPPARGTRREVADDEAAARGARRLLVERGHAVVADVRVREGHHLAGVARVGEHLLVAAHRGVEDELADAHPVGWLEAGGLAGEGRAVGEHEGRSGAAHRVRHGVLHARGALLQGVTDGHRQGAPDVRAVSRPARERPRREREAASRGRRRTGSQPPRARRRHLARSGRRDRSSVARSLAIAAGRRDSSANSATRSTSATPPSAPTVSPSACCRPSIPNAAWSNGRSFASGACGAWSVATASTAPSRSELEEPREVLVGAQRRVHLEQRVVVRARAVGQREVVRGDLAGDVEPVASRGVDEADGLGDREVLEVQRTAGQLEEAEVARDDQRLGERRLAAPARAWTTTHPRGRHRPRRATRPRSAVRT